MNTKIGLHTTNHHLPHFFSQHYKNSKSKTWIEAEHFSNKVLCLYIACLKYAEVQWAVKADKVSSVCRWQIQKTGIDNEITKEWVTAFKGSARILANLYKLINWSVLIKVCHKEKVRKESAMEMKKWYLKQSNIR